MFIIQLSVLRYLLRQGLAIWGHDEEGNFMQLMKTRAEGDIALQKWITEGRYQSPDILNELISLMGNELLRQILNNVKEARWFAVFADETRGISNSEQLCVFIQWVGNDYTIYEDVTGLMQVPKTDAKIVTMAIKDVLIRCSI